MILPLEWTIKTCLIAATAFGVSLLLRRFSAAIRHLVWAAAFCAIVLLPLCSRLIPFSLPSKIPAPITRVLVPPQPSRSIGPADSLRSLESPAPFLRLRAIALALRWPALIWLAGCLVSAVVLVVGSVRLAWTAHRSTPFLDARWARAGSELSGAFGLKRSVRLLQSSNSSMPVTWGLLRPRVLLPANAQNWPDTHIRAVLTHEFAHIRRYDWGIQMLAEIVRAVYWFNPLLWIASTRLRQEGEHACDDEVLRLGVDGTEYAGHILDIARMLKAKKGAWSPTIAMACPSNLERRFAAMVHPSLDRRAVTRNMFLVTALLALLIVVPLAAVRAQIVPGAVRFSGNVYDAKGAAIPNARIILTRADDATQRAAAESNRAGVFEFPKLAPGHYSVDIIGRGFAPLHINDIEVDATRNTPLNAMLPAENSIAANPSEPAKSRPGPRGSGPTHQAQEYRMGDIKFMGNKAINTAQVRLALAQTPGQVYSEDRLRLGFEALKKLYGNIGYINFTAEPRFDFDEPQKIVNLTVEIAEDRQFTVNRINFTGDTQTRDDVIRREILLKEGDVFNASLWDHSLDRLNQLGYVDQIKNEDASFKLSPTEPTVDITLTIREKNRN
jgi:beta-lactamase regulating signal transducer with metallopeptidase domain